MSAVSIKTRIVGNGLPGRIGFPGNAFSFVTSCETVNCSLSLKVYFDRVTPFFLYAKLITTKLKLNKFNALTFNTHLTDVFLSFIWTNVWCSVFKST